HECERLTISSREDYLKPAKTLYQQLSRCAQGIRRFPAIQQHVHAGSGSCSGVGLALLAAYKRFEPVLDKGKNGQAQCLSTIEYLTELIGKTISNAAFAELRGFTAVQPPAASSRYPGGARSDSQRSCRRLERSRQSLEQLEAEYENLRKMLPTSECSAAAAASASRTSSTRQPSSTRLEASSFATSTSSASSAAVATVGGPSTPVDLTRPASAERKRQAYKAELERQLASLQSSKPFAASRLPRARLRRCGGGGGLGSYGLGIYEGLSASQAAAPTSNRGVRFVEPSLTNAERGSGCERRRRRLLALRAPSRSARLRPRPGRKAEYAKEQRRPARANQGRPGQHASQPEAVMRETDDDRLSQQRSPCCCTGDGYDDFRSRGGDFSSGVAPAGSADPDDWMQHLDGLKDLQTRLSKSFTDDFGGFSNATAANATNSRQQKDVQQQEKQTAAAAAARQRWSRIFGRGLSDEQKRQRERYQEELRQQRSSSGAHAGRGGGGSAGARLKKRQRPAEERGAAAGAEEQRKQAAAGGGGGETSTGCRFSAGAAPAAQHHHQQQQHQHQQQHQRYSPRAASPPVPAISNSNGGARPKQQKPPTPRQQQQQHQQQQPSRQSTAASVASAPEPESIEQLARPEESAAQRASTNRGSSGTLAEAAPEAKPPTETEPEPTVDVFDMARDRRKAGGRQPQIAASSAVRRGRVQLLLRKTFENALRNLTTLAVGGRQTWVWQLSWWRREKRFESMQRSDSESALLSTSTSRCRLADLSSLERGSGGAAARALMLKLLGRLTDDRADANEGPISDCQRLQADAVSLNDPRSVEPDFIRVRLGQSAANRGMKATI
uniref:Rho-GAP domain-containing protein n=1 Tax=Macrostomum lignano TaxID=282301 RepID=A0A1I8FR83_9PLAT